MGQGAESDHAPAGACGGSWRRDGARRSGDGGVSEALEGAKTALMDSCVTGEGADAPEVEGAAGALRLVDTRGEGMEAEKGVGRYSAVWAAAQGR